MWMGLIDGIYAIAMTLIAIELPELASQLIGTINQKVETTTIIGLLIYELVAYTATFLILYEYGHSTNLFSSSLESDTPDRT